jgi:hypothetical protein
MDPPRFDFGKNWQAFLSTVTSDSIANAEESVTPDEVKSHLTSHGFQIVRTFETPVRASGLVRLSLR